MAAAAGRTLNINISLNFGGLKAEFRKFREELISELRRIATEAKIKFSVDGDAAEREGAEAGRRARDAFGRFTKDAKIGVDTASAEKGLGGFGDRVSKVMGGVKGKISEALTIAGGNVLGGIIGQLGSGLADGGEKVKAFEDALADVSIVTEKTGPALEDIGNRGRGLALKFGGDAATQVNAFGTVISKFGPQIGDSAPALESMGDTLNTLGQSSTEGATVAVESLTGAMLQFKLVDTEAPLKTAENMKRVANVFQAGTAVGSASVKQTADAIKVAGVALNGANVQIEEGVAAIQLLGEASIYGSEAGTALRDVQLKLNEGRFLPKETATELKAAGVDIEKLGNKTIPLADRLQELQKIQNDSALVAKLFGSANVGAATQLIQNTDKLRKWTGEVSGTNAAFDGAAKKANTFSSVMARLQATIGDVAISVFTALSPLLNVVAGIVSKIATALAPLLTTIAGAFGKLADPLLALITPIITALSSILTPMIDFAGVLIGVIGNIATAIAPLLQTILGLFVSIFQAGLAPILQIVGQLLPPLVAAFLPLVGIIQQLLDAIIPLVVQLNPNVILFQILGPVLQALLPPLTEIIGSIVQLAVVLIGALLPVLNLLIPLFAQGLKLAAQGLGAALAAIVGVIASVAAILVDGLSIALQAVIQWITVAVQWIIQAGRDIGEFLTPVIDFLGKAFSVVAGVIASLVIPIFRKLGEWAGVVWGWLKKLADFLIGPIVQGWRDLQKFASDTADVFTNEIVPALEALWTWFRNLVTTIADTVAQFFGFSSAGAAFTTVMNIVNQAIDAVIGFFTNLEVEMAGIGRAFELLGAMAVAFFKNIATLNFEAAADVFKNFFERLEDAYLDGKQRAIDEANRDKITLAPKVETQPVAAPPAEGTKPEEPKTAPATSAAKKKDEKKKEAFRFDTADDIDREIARLEDLLKRENDAIEKALLEAQIRQLEIQRDTQKEIEKIREDAAKRRKDGQVVLADETAISDARTKGERAAGNARIDAIRSINAALLAEEKRNADTRLADMQAAEKTIDAITFSATRRRGELRLQILLEQQERERREIIAALPEFQAESEAIAKALAEETIDVETAERQLAELYTRYATFNDRLKNLAIVNAQDRLAIERETLEALAELRSKLIVSAAARERADALRELRITADAQLILLAQAEALARELRLEGLTTEEELAATIKAIQEARTAFERQQVLARFRIEEEYQRRTNILVRISYMIRNGIVRAFTLAVNDEERKRLEEQRKNLATEEEQLLQSYKNREISTLDFLRRRSELIQKQNALDVAGEEGWEQTKRRIKEAGVIASAEFEKEQAAAAGEAQETYTAVYITAAAERRTREREISEAVKAGKLDEISATLELSRAEAEEQKKIAGARGDALIATGAAVVASTLSMMAQGEDGFKAFGLAMLAASFDLLQAQVPIWIASIFGVEASTKGLAGIPIALAITGLLQGLVAGAKAVVLGSIKGDADGEVPIKGPGGPRSDLILRRVSAGEAVIQAQAVAAGDNTAWLAWANETGRPLEEWPGMQAWFEQQMRKVLPENYLSDLTSADMQIPERLRLKLGKALESVSGWDMPAFGGAVGPFGFMIPPALGNALTMPPVEIDLVSINDTMQQSLHYQRASAETIAEVRDEIKELRKEQLRDFSQTRLRVAEMKGEVTTIRQHFQNRKDPPPPPPAYPMS